MRPRKIENCYGFSLFNEELWISTRRLIKKRKIAAKKKVRKPSKAKGSKSQKKMEIDRKKNPKQKHYESDEDI